MDRYKRSLLPIHILGSRESGQTRSSTAALLESPSGESAVIGMEPGSPLVETDDHPGSPCHQFEEMWLPGRILHVTPRETRIGDEVIEFEPETLLAGPMSNSTHCRKKNMILER